MFLAFDVFFAIFCIALACVIGIALCCCLPCIIAFLYAIAGQKGASDADISILPRFRFRQVNQEAKFDLENQKAVTLTVAEPTRDSIDEIALSPEDSVSIFSPFLFSFLSLYAHRKVKNNCMEEPCGPIYFLGSVAHL